jgi:hypothetical protein
MVSASGPFLNSVDELAYQISPAVPAKITKMSRAMRRLRQDFILHGKIEGYRRLVQIILQGDQEDPKILNSKLLRQGYGSQECPKNDEIPKHPNTQGSPKS